MAVVRTGLVTPAGVGRPVLTTDPFVTPALEPIVYGALGTSNAPQLGNSLQSDDRQNWPIGCNRHSSVVDVVRCC